MTTRIYLTPETRLKFRRIFLNTDCGCTEFEVWLEQYLGRKVRQEGPEWDRDVFRAQPSKIFFEFDDDSEAVKFKLEHL